MQRGLEFSATTTATLLRNPAGVWPSPSARLRYGLILRVEQVFFIIIVIITTAAVAMKKCPLFCCFMAMKFVLGSDAICTCSEDLHVFFWYKEVLPCERHTPGVGEVRWADQISRRKKGHTGNGVRNFDLRFLPAVNLLPDWCKDYVVVQIWKWLCS